MRTWRLNNLGVIILLAAAPSVLLSNASATPADDCGVLALSAVSADTANDVQAIGICNSDFGWDAVVENWDGTAWHYTIVDGQGGRTSNELDAISVVSSSDVWVAGHYNDVDGGPGHYFSHWNGKKWARFSNDEANGRVWLGISALSDGHVFALGQAAGNKSLVVQRGQGQIRSFVPGNLESISVASATDGWAVGGRFADHWDGTVWSRVPIPGAAAVDLALRSVSATGSDVWAVGAQTVHGVERKVVEHFIDGAWVAVSTPSLRQASSSLSSVSAQSPSDVWAVGNTGDGRMFSMHWDGVTWAVAYLTSKGLDEPTIASVTSVPGGVWAVGGEKDNGGSVREFWNGSTWVIQ